MYAATKRTFTVALERGLVLITVIESTGLFTAPKKAQGIYCGC